MSRNRKKMATQSQPGPMGAGESIRPAVMSGGVAVVEQFDDPDAIEALRSRIEGLEAQRATIKAENAAYRATHREELKGLTAYGRDKALPHPSYVLTNLGGNITRNRKRLTQLEGQ